jgi:hypothetical protein
MTTRGRWAHRGARVAVAAVMAAAALQGQGARGQAQPGLQITSPGDGTVVYPGQSVTVVVSPAPGTTFTAVAVLAQDPLPFQYATAPPYQFSVAIPEHIAAGRYRVIAEGVVAPEQSQKSPAIYLDVEPPATLSVSRIQVAPDAVLFRRMGERIPLRVTGTFSDGSTMDVSQSTGTTYTAVDTTVATVTGTGSVTAVGVGATGVKIQYGGQTITVPVQLPPQTDTTPPATTATLSPAANSAGWNNSDVTVTLTAQDVGTNASGVKQITYSATGAQAITNTIVAAATASFVINIEGTTTVSYFSTDNAGNVESAKTLTVKLDKTLPAVNCASPDSQWHANDVTIACTASDSGSGLANAADVNFSLSTSVPAGTETANASTNTRSVCDVAGNCAAAGPITDIMVDKKPPTVTITVPAAGTPTLALSQILAASYSCTDGGSGVATCSGPVASGASLDTSSVGNKPFVVNATDKVGNSSSASAPYVVDYNVCVLYDQTMAVHSGAVIPIKLELCNFNGNDVSASAITVHATGVVLVSTNAPGTLESVGNANPDNDFRFDSTLGPTGGYIFNLSTQGLATGTYQLSFTASGDPTQHSVQFQVRD